MENVNVLEFIARWQFAFMFSFCTFFGVLANESLSRILHPDKPKWVNMMPKFFVALFVTMLVHGFYEIQGYESKYEYIAILTVSFLHMEIGQFIRVKLFPIIIKIVINSLSNKKDNDG